MIERAMLDLRCKTLESKKARKWFFDDAKHPLSFQWCAELLGYDTEPVRYKAQAIYDDKEEVTNEFRKKR